MKNGGKKENGNKRKRNCGAGLEDIQRGGE